MVFWNVAPCRMVEIDRLFKGAYCFYNQGNWCTSKRRPVSTRLHGATPRRQSSSCVRLHRTFPVLLVYEVDSRGCKYNGNSRIEIRRISQSLEKCDLETV
jgi:hypothetical protein